MIAEAKMIMMLNYASMILLLCFNWIVRNHLINDYDVKLNLSNRIAVALAQPPFRLTLASNYASMHIWIFLNSNIQMRVTCPLSCLYPI